MAIKNRQYVNSYDSLGRNEYYERVIFPERISLFSDIWKSEKKMIPKDLSVAFRGLSFGSGPDAVAGVLGQPRFAIENHGMSSLIYFYKERINNHRIITQIHFWGKEFFYAGYTFRDETDSERKLIKKILFEKYAVINNDLAHVQDHLEDRDGNIISVHDSVNFNIVYLWGDNKIKNAVSENTFSLRFGRNKEMLKEMADLKSKL